MNHASDGPRNIASRGGEAPAISAIGSEGGPEVGTVEVERLTKRYGDAYAVREVGFAIGSGVFLTLVGPSGSGKSTLLNLLLGLEQADSGDIKVGGRSVVHVPPFRRNIGMVFQHYALFPHLSVAENLAYPLRRRGIRAPERQRKVADILELVRLGGFGERAVQTLSGGQQQRVALGRALISSPSVLLLDEPLAALDKALREDLQVELKILQRTVGTTAILVTHDQQEALALGDQIGVMNEGRLEQIGPAEQVYRRPDSSFVARFLGGASLFLGVAERGASGWGVTLPSGVRLPGHPGRPLDGSVGRFPAVLAVNPAVVEILPGAAPIAPGTLTARITAMIFAGHVFTVHLELTDGSPVVARSSDLRGQRIGAQAGIRWAQEDAFIFPAHA